MIATLLAYAAAYVAEGLAISYTSAYFAVTFAVSAIVSRIFAVDENANSSIDNGVRQQVPPAMSNSIPLVYGDAYLGGTFVDAVLSVDQKVMYYVMAISNISPNGQFTYDRTKFYYGDRLVTFDATDTTKVVSLTDGAGNVDTKVSGNLYINLYTSTAAGVITNVTGTSPSTFMGGSDIASAQRWTGTRQMNGLAFAIIKLTYSQEAGTTQMQPVTFHVGHYLNGTGVAKPGDVWLDYISSETYGGGMAASLIDSASGTALNTYSDATITYTPSTGGTATQARYRINGVLDTGQNVLSNIDRIMAACDSWNQYNAATGKWTIVINKDTSTTFAFDDTNVIGEIKTSLVDITSSINQVEASFPNSINRDQRDVVYLETPSGLLYPNEPINKYSCNLDLVNNSVQATYLANRMLEQAREDLLVTISAAYPAIQVDAGDVVSLTNAAYGWSGKLFRAMKVSETSLNDGTLGASLDLIEYNADVYADGSITAFTPSPNSNLISAQYFSPLNPPVVSASRPTATIPSFDVQVTTPTIGRVNGIGLFYTTVATPAIGDWNTLDKVFAPTNGVLANSTVFSFLNQTLPANTYYFGALVMNDVGQSAISGVSASFAWIPTGTVGTQTAQVNLYQWAATTPSSPTGSSTWTWATATNSAYTGGGGWQVTIPTNPGTAGWNLYQATKGISDFASATTTTVSWTSGVTISSIAQNGAAGTPGASGTKSITITAFRWANSGAGTYTQAFTYTWSSGAVSAYPSGWTSAASTSPGTGYTLYMISLIVTDTATATSTNTNWSGATLNSIGYTQDGSIGPQGNNARIMYAKCASGSSPTGTTSTTGSTSFPVGQTFFGVNWILFGGLYWQASPPTLSADESLFQSDGIYTTGGSTLWQTPYLSNLKVGSLSAISANLGVVQISTAGNLYSGKSSYASTTAGFFLGNDGGTPRLSIGDATNSMQWTGTALNITGSITGASSIDITGSAKFNGQTTIGGFTYALSANRPTASTYGTSLRGIIGAAQGDAAGQAIGVEGLIADTATNPGYAGVWGRATGTSTVAYGVRGEAGSGIAGSFASTFGKALELSSGSGIAPMTVNNTVVVTNLNAEYWNGVQGAGIALNGSSGTLPTAYPPVSLTYNAVRYIQISVGGITGYIPVYI